MANTTHTTVEMDTMVDGHQAGPLDDINRNVRAVPESDDEFDDRPILTDHNIGVDDGLLPGAATKGGHNERNGGLVPTLSTRSTGHEPRFVNINGVDTEVPDINAYQHKKTFAQGMLDLALLTANANQLRYILDTSRNHPYYYPSIVLIILSIICQVGVGVGLVWISRYNVHNDKHICRANRINNYTVIGVFIVTVVNVFISAFSVSTPI